MCSRAAPSSPPEAPSAGWGPQSGQQSPEMLQARLSPPFISPVSLGTASGEGGSRDGSVQTAQEKICSHRESEGDLPTPLQMLAFKKQLAPAWFLAIFTS